MAVTTFTPRFVGRKSETCLDMPRLSMIGRAVRAVQLGLKRRAAIRALGALDEHLLSDIGIDRTRIEAETDAMLARAEHGAD